MKRRIHSAGGETGEWAPKSFRGSPGSPAAKFQLPDGEQNPEPQRCYSTVQGEDLLLKVSVQLVWMHFYLTSTRMLTFTPGIYWLSSTNGAHSPTPLPWFVFAFKVWFQQESCGSSRNRTEASNTYIPNWTDTHSNNPHLCILQEVDKLNYPSNPHITIKSFFIKLWLTSLFFSSIC